MKSVAISKFLVSIVLASADEHPSVGTKELAHRSFAPVRHSRTSLISGSERDEGWGKPSRFLLYHANMRSNKILHHRAIADAALRQPPSLSHHHNPSRHPRSTQSIGPARINRNQQTIARPCTAIGQCTLLKLLTVCSRPDVSFSATHLFSLYPVQNDGGRRGRDEGPDYFPLVKWRASMHVLFQISAPQTLQSRKKREKSSWT